MNKKLTANSKAVKGYARTFRRIAKAIDARCRITGETPSVKLIPSQVGMRASRLTPSSIRTEKTAIRQVLEVIHEQFMIDEVGDVAWVPAIVPEDVVHVINELEAPVSTLAKSGNRLIEKAHARLQNAGDDHSHEEVSALLHGRHIASTRATGKGGNMVSRREYMALEVELGQEDPIEAIASLNTPRANIRGLLRIFVSTLYLTGIRPAEAWKMRLMVPRADIAMDDEMRKLILADPTTAISTGMMWPVDEAAETLGVNVGEAARTCMRIAMAPAILVVSSVKRTNANKDVKSPIRLLILQNIPSHGIDMIACASELRTLKITNRRRESLHASLLRMLRRITTNDLTIKRSDINLYTFRHTFSARARRSLPRQDVAVIMGHTALSSVYSYGEKRGRKTSAGSVRPDDWLPGADQVQARELAQHWMRNETSFNPEVERNTCE